MVAKGALTLERLLEEKRMFDLTAGFERMGADDEEDGEGDKGWREPGKLFRLVTGCLMRDLKVDDKISAPSSATALTTLPSPSNILSVSAAPTQDTDGKETAMMLITTAARRLHILDAATQTLRASLLGLADSPILSTAVFRSQYILTASMSGQLLLSDLEGRVLEERRDHGKYIVKIAVHDPKPHGDDGDDSAHAIIATASWDCTIKLYRPSTSGPGHPPTIGAPYAAITLPTKPEALLFTPHPVTNETLILLARADSTHLHFYPTNSANPQLLARQNLAPHSNAWIAFTPSALAPHPTDPSIVAVATSSTPHMKLLIVRLLALPLPGDDLPAAPETQTSQSRAALARAEKEDAAILIHANTLAPQTPYSTPCVAWRPDGSGLWVNGDDGMVRGVEARSGKVMVVLKGHEAGSKVRCLWAGEIPEREGGKEVLVSGGFDQKVLVWKAGG